MRKIELGMNTAIKSKLNWSSGNTTVAICDNGLIEVRLHGNLIAYGTDHNNLKPKINTLLKHPTITTLSRLRALGITVNRKKGCYNYKRALI